MRVIFAAPLVLEPQVAGHAEAMQAELAARLGVRVATVVLKRALRAAAG